MATDQGISVRFAAQARFYLRRSVRTRLLAHPVGTGRSYTGVQKSEGETDYSPPPSAEVTSLWRRASTASHTPSRCPQGQQYIHVYFIYLIKKYVCHLAILSDGENTECTNKRAHNLHLVFGVKTTKLFINIVLTHASLLPLLGRSTAFIIPYVKNVSSCDKRNRKSDGSIICLHFSRWTSLTV